MKKPWNRLKYLYSHAEYSKLNWEYSGVDQGGLGRSPIHYLDWPHIYFPNMHVSGKLILLEVHRPRLFVL